MSGRRASAAPAAASIACALLASLVLCAPAAGAATVIHTPDGSAAAITAALAALPDDGGVVVIPPGEWAWGADDEVRIGRDHVVVLGLGAERTLLYRTNSKDDVAFFRVRDAADVRISGLRFQGVERYGNTDIDYGVLLWDVIDFRVDHCTFSYLGFAGVRTHGASRGVVDHCRFSRHYKPPVGSYGYGVAVYGTDQITGLPFGTAEATFVEDSEMGLCRHAVASNKGARYVFRHNLVRHNTKAHAIDAHGQEFSSDGSVGTEWIVVHDNVVERPNLENTDSSRKYAVRIRGGRGLVYDNAFADVDEGVRIDEFTPQSTGPVYVWGNELTRDPDPDSRARSCARTQAEGDLLCVHKVPRGRVEKPADGVSEFVERPPADYTPFPYPHPLTRAWVADAGPDRAVLLRDGETEARAALPVTSPTGDGVTVADRWFVDGVEVPAAAAGGPRLALTAGPHTLVRVVRAADGRMAADVAELEVLTAFSPLDSGQRAWMSRWFTPLGGRAEVRFQLTPGEAAMDGYVSLAGPVDVAAHGDNAMHVRVNNEGLFDARRGPDEYAADQVLPYEPGASYTIRLVFDADAGRYSVWVDDVALATDYPFRAAASAVHQLTAWHSTGGLTVRGLALTPLPPADADAAGSRAGAAPTEPPAAAPVKGADPVAR